MTMAADVRALWCALHDLRDAVLPMRMLAVEDRPGSIAPQPVHAVADGLDSVFGRLQQAISELSQAIDTDGETGSRDRVVAALGRCNATFVELGREWTAFHSDYRVANAEVASIVTANPSLLGFACVNAKSDADRVSEMVGKAVRDWGFRGIKVHRHQASLTREVREAARRWQVPVLYDVAGAAHTLEMIASQYPDVPLIVPHLGSFADDWRAHLTMIDMLRRFPNVYADTSGVRRFGYLVAAVRRAGARKLIFGSDGPWLHPGLELHKIRLLGLSADDEAAVLGGNLTRLLARAKGRERVGA